MLQIAILRSFAVSTEILFSKLGSAGLNYNLPKRKLFTFPYCAVSNKRCLLTFFSFEQSLERFTRFFHVNLRGKAIFGPRGMI